MKDVMLEQCLTTNKCVYIVQFCFCGLEEKREGQTHHFVIVVTLKTNEL